MASHAQLAITKASLLAALLKPTPDADLPACSRTDIEALHGLLSAAAARCSPANVQKCKLWMLKHLAASSNRTAAFGKYLVAFANSQTATDAKTGVVAPPTKPSVKRKRLHLLYVLCDAFYHVKHRTAHDRTFFGALEPHLPAFFRSAAAFSDAPKHAKKLQDLIQLWQKENYFPATVLDQLRDVVTKGPAADSSEATEGTPKGRQAANSTASGGLARDAPYVLPSMHGDPSTPWYDLPAANWLPVIEPNSTRPMNPAMIKPLQLASGPADKSLILAVKKLLGDVDKIYAKTVQIDGDAPPVDISQMGEVVERDAAGEIVGGETYYGWSRKFCEKMKARRKGDPMDVDDEEDDRRDRRGSSESEGRMRSRGGRGRSSSRSSSRPVMKRRRLSPSRSRSRSRDRSRSRSRSYSRRRSRSYSSRSRSRSRSPRRRSRNGRDSRSRSRSDSYSPPRAIGAGTNTTNNPPPPPPHNGPPHNAFTPPIPQQQQQFFHQPPPPPPPPHHFPGAPPPPPLNYASGPPSYMQHPLPHPPQQHHIPPPPPPPQHYQGQWPPPPPPISGLPQPTAQGWFPPPNSASSPPPPMPTVGWAGGWGAPQPHLPAGMPPMPQQGGYGYAPPNNNNNRGGGGGGYRGRGGYGRGRGW